MFSDTVLPPLGALWKQAPPQLLAGLFGQAAFPVRCEGTERATLLSRADLSAHGQRPYNALVSLPAESEHACTHSIATRGNVV